MVMMPEEFRRKMEELSDMTDTEERHVDMDGLMCDLLITLGYADGIDIFDNTHKWYA